MDNIVCESCSDGVCIEKIKCDAFSKLSFSEKKQVIEIGRPTPDLQLIQTKGKVNRKFNTKQYDSYHWLTGCIHSNRLFCFVCLLFSNNKTVWNDIGYADIHNFPTAARKHEQSEKHLESSLKYHTFGKNRIETRLNSQIQIDIDRHNAKVDRNRNIFQRLIDIVCFLGKQELAFRGHDESASSVNKGNYLEMVDVLAKYDGVLENHIQNCTSSFTGLSNRIQNDLISSVASVMIETIKQQIASTDFVAVMVDETPDVSGKEQLVLVLRYFHKSEVFDRFIKYIDVSSDRTAKTLSAIILLILSEFNCLSKLVAQTYDGAAVLSSERNGVQSLVRQQCPLAEYVWCSAHVLNLVLSKSCERIPETKRFFNLIKTLANFFNNSTKRQNHYNKMADMKKLPRVADTRWTYNSRTVNVIFNSSLHLIDLFEDMAENEDSWDGETLSQVSYLLHNLKDFQFQFLLHVFNEIFAETDVLYEIMQKKTSDVTYCIKKIRDFESFLESFRSRFELIFEGVKIITGPPKRKRNVVDAKTNFKRIFIEIIDNISIECRDRYKNLKELKFFGLLSCENFNKYNDNFPVELVSQFVNVYKLYDFNLDRLINELKCVYKSAEFKNLSIYKIIEHFYENNINTVFPEVLRLAKLIVTVPASSASTERSFSSLKRIHTYLRNTQGQQRLTDLSTISIEKNLLTEIKRLPNFYDSILQIFLQKDRRVDLIYK